MYPIYQFQQTDLKTDCLSVVQCPAVGCDDQQPVAIMAVCSTVGHDSQQPIAVDQHPLRTACLAVGHDDQQPVAIMAVCSTVGHSPIVGHDSQRPIAGDQHPLRTDYSAVGQGLTVEYGNQQLSAGGQHPQAIAECSLVCCLNGSRFA